MNKAELIKYKPSHLVLIELARGDYISKYLEGTPWTDPSQPHYKIMKAAMYKMTGAPYDSPRMKEIRRRLKQGIITPKEAKEAIDEYRSGIPERRAAQAADEMLKADVETNVTARHNALHQKIARAVDDTNRRIADAEKVGNKSLASLIRKEHKEYVEREIAKAKREIHGDNVEYNRQRGMIMRKNARKAIIGEALRERRIRNAIKRELFSTPAKTLEEAARRREIAASMSELVRERLQKNAVNRITSRRHRLKTGLQDKIFRSVMEEARRSAAKAGGKASPSISEVRSRTEQYIDRILHPEKAAIAVTEEQARKMFNEPAKALSEDALKEWQKAKVKKVREIYKKLEDSDNELLNELIDRMVKERDKKGRNKYIGEALQGIKRDAASPYVYRGSIAKAPVKIAKELGNVLLAPIKKYPIPAALLGAGALTAGGLYAYNRFKNSKELEKEKTGTKKLASRTRLIEFGRKLGGMGKTPKRSGADKIGKFGEGHLTPDDIAIEKAIAEAWQRSLRVRRPKFAKEVAGRQKTKIERVAEGKHRDSFIDAVTKLEQESINNKYDTYLNPEGKRVQGYPFLMAISLPNELRNTTQAKALRRILARRLIAKRIYERGRQHAKAEIDRLGQNLEKQLAEVRDLKRKFDIQKEASAKARDVYKARAEERLNEANARFEKLKKDSEDNIRALRRQGSRDMAISGAAGLIGGGLMAAPATYYIMKRRNKDNANTSKGVHQFSSKDDKKMDPYVMATLSGAASGAGLGMLSYLKKGVTAKQALKAAAISALVSGGIVGGGSLLGSAILGRPKEEESAAFTKRAALGGLLVGGSVGAGFGALSKSKRVAKTKFGRKLHLLLAKLDDWKPVSFLRRRSVPVAILGGAGMGAAYGLGQGADEGQQVDSIRNISREMKFSTDLDEPMPRSAVARHRYINSIQEKEWIRNQNNFIKSALAGGLLGNIIRKKLGLKRAEGMLVGAGSGITLQGLVNATQKRDMFGEKSPTQKRIEALPWLSLGLASAGILGGRLYKRLRKVKNIKLSAKDDVIRFGIAADAGDFLSRSLLNQYQEDRKAHQDYKQWKRAQRKASTTRRDIQRGVNLARDLPLKLQGREKLDSRGRVRKNEWDKSWVRNALIATGLAGALFVGNKSLQGIRRDAAKAREVGSQGTGAALLYNALRDLVKSNKTSANGKSIVGSALYRFIRNNRGITRPILRTRTAIMRAAREAKQIMNDKAEDIGRAISRSTPSRPVKMRYDQTDNTAGKNLYDILFPDGSLPREPLKKRSRRSTSKGRRKTDSGPDNVITGNFSAKGKEYAFSNAVDAIDSVEIVPVVPHVRRRRSTKEEIGKESLYEERARHARDKMLLASLGLGGGATATYAWYKLSPKQRDLVRKASANEKEIETKVNEELQRRMGEHPEQHATRQKIMSEQSRQAASRRIRHILGKEGFNVLKWWRRAAG